MSEAADEGPPIPRRASGVPSRSFSLAPNVNPLRQSTKDNRVLINVGGVRYETYKSTLKNLPDTRLSWLTETTAQNADFDTTTGEYFFDRHPGVFNMVLNYYRTGKLHAPTDVCGPLFEEELAFWGIDEMQIEPCCWMSYRTHRDAENTLKELESEDWGDEIDDEDEDDTAQRFGIEEEVAPGKSWWDRWRPRLWNMFDEPASSRGAKMIAYISYVFIIISISTFCLETLPSLRVPLNESDPITPEWSARDILRNSTSKTSVKIVDFTCIAFFTLELILRLVLCPSKREFLKSSLNWIDILTVIPSYVEFVLFAVKSDVQYTQNWQIFRISRLFRVFRIFRLTRHFSGLKIIGHTMKASAKELFLLILFLMISVLIFGCLIYYAEIINEKSINDFGNIPIGFWWALVTMTTLGYGDMYPRTEVGYIIGSLCALAGVLVLALPVPVIVNNFALYYGHAQARLKLPKKKRRAMVNAPDQLKVQTMRPGDSVNIGSRPNLSPLGERAEWSHEQFRRDSNGSQDSTDSGIKTGSSQEGGGQGISVIFTDEMAPPIRHSLSNGGPRVSPIVNGGPGRKHARRARTGNSGALPAVHPPSIAEEVEPRRLSTANLTRDAATRRRSSMRPHYLTDIDV